MDDAVTLRVSDPVPVLDEVCEDVTDCVWLCEGLNDCDGDAVGLRVNVMLGLIVPVMLGVCV